MKKQNIFLSAMFLTIASFITRIMGFVFRVFLSNTIKAEGMGLYQLILTLYTVVIALAASGIALAVSRLVSEDLARPKTACPRKIVHMSVAFSACLSIAIAAIMFVFANPLGEYVLSDSRTASSLRILALGIPCISISSAFKGYFLAVRRSITTALSNILEESLKIGITILLFSFYNPSTIEESCILVVVGMTLGEFFSCAYLAIAYHWNVRKQPNAPKSRKGIVKNIVKIVAPITASSGINSILRLVENVLIIAGLTVFLIDATEATSIYGILKGMVMPLMLFPTTLLTSLVNTLIPEVSRANALENRKMIARTVSKVIQFTLLFAVVIVSVFMIFPQELGSIFFNDVRVGEMLKFLSVLCPLMYLEIVVTGILNALGEQASPMKYNVIDSVLRIVLIYLLVPVYGMQGFLWIMVFSNLLTSLLNIRKLLKVTALSFKIAQWLIKPAIAALSSGFAIKILCTYFFTVFLSPVASLVLGILCILTAYFILLFPLECINSYDIQYLKEAILPMRKKKQKNI